MSDSPPTPTPTAPSPRPRGLFHLRPAGGPTEASLRTGRPFRLRPQPRPIRLGQVIGTGPSHALIGHSRRGRGRRQAEVGRRVADYVTPPWLRRFRWLAWTRLASPGAARRPRPRPRPPCGPAAARTWTPQAKVPAAGASARPRRRVSDPRARRLRPPRGSPAAASLKASDGRGSASGPLGRVPGAPASARAAGGVPGRPPSPSGGNAARSPGSLGAGGRAELTARSCAAAPGNCGAPGL